MPSDESGPPNRPPEFSRDQFDHLLRLLSQLQALQLQATQQSRMIEALIEALIERVGQQGGARASPLLPATSAAPSAMADDVADDVTDDVTDDVADDVADAEAQIQFLLGVRPRSARKTIQWLHVDFPRLLGPLAALYEIVQSNVSQAGVLNGVTSAYWPLIKRIHLDLPLRDTAAAVEFYELLAVYLDQTRRAANCSDAVRAVWDQQIPEIAFWM